MAQSRVRKLQSVVLYKNDSYQNLIVTEQKKNGSYGVVSTAIVLILVITNTSNISFRSLGKAAL